LKKIETSEAAVKNSIRNWLNKHQCFRFAMGGNFMGGMPDTIITIRAGVAVESYDDKPDTAFIDTHIVVGIECKRPGKDATDKQKAKHEELRAHGWVVGVVHSLDELKKLLSDHGIKLIKN